MDMTMLISTLVSTVAVSLAVGIHGTLWQYLLRMVPLAVLVAYGFQAYIRTMP